MPWVTTNTSGVWLCPSTVTSTTAFAFPVYQTSATTIPWNWYEANVYSSAPRFVPQAPAVLRGRSDEADGYTLDELAAMEELAAMTATPPIPTMPAPHPERLAAEARAAKLFYAILRPEHREEWRRDGRVTMAGKSGQVYVINRGRIANIDVLRPDGAIDHRLCVHPPPDLPLSDVLVAQYLHLRADDIALRRIANRHPAPMGQRAA